MLNGLLAPLRIPEHVVAVLEALGEAAHEMGPMRAELTRVREQTERVPEILSVAERISSQTKLLAQLLSAVEGVEKSLRERLDSLHAVVVSLESEDSYLNHTVGELAGDLRAMHETVAALKGDVEHLTDRMPDPNRGPLEKARDAFTSSSE